MVSLSVVIIFERCRSCTSHAWKTTTPTCNQIPFHFIWIHFNWNLFQLSLRCRIINEATKEAAVVDPVEPHKILRVAQENGVDLKLLLTTHHHWFLSLLPFPFSTQFINSWASFLYFWIASSLFVTAKFSRNLPYCYWISSAMIWMRIYWIVVLSGEQISFFGGFMVGIMLVAMTKWNSWCLRSRFLGVLLIMCRAALTNSKMVIPYLLGLISIYCLSILHGMYGLTIIYLCDYACCNHF